MSYTELMTAAFCQTRRRTRCRNQLLTVHSTTARRVSGSTFLSTPSPRKPWSPTLLSRSGICSREFLKATKGCKASRRSATTMSKHQFPLPMLHSPLANGAAGSHRYHLTGIILTSPILAKARPTNLMTVAVYPVKLEAISAYSVIYR